MAEWITIEDLLDEFSAGNINNKELPYIGEDEEGDLILNEDKINNAIVSARLEIESYLKAADVPTEPTPEDVIRKLRPCILNITRFYYSDVDGSMFETIEKRYNICKEKLNAIVSGKIVIYEDPESGKGNGGVQQIPLWRG